MGYRTICSIPLYEVLEIVRNACIYEQDIFAALIYLMIFVIQRVRYNVFKGYY